MSKSSPKVSSTVGLKNVVLSPLLTDTDEGHTYGDLQLMRRRSGIIFLRGAITLNSSLSSGSGTAGQVQIGTIAAAYRPEQVYDFPIVLAKTNGYLRMIVNSSGAVTLHNFSGYAIGTSMVIPLCACWCAKD